MARLHPLRIRLTHPPFAATPMKNKEPERRRPIKSPAFFLWRRGADLALLIALDTSDAALQWRIVADAPTANDALPTVQTELLWNLDACFGETMAGAPWWEGCDETGVVCALWAVDDPDEISLLQVMGESITRLSVAAQPPSVAHWPCALFFTTNEIPANWPSLPPGLSALIE
ncbi:MAG TPA: hypothetical protein PK961_03245 [bacterium]|nr:hypothetical protein [bacterium]